MENDFISDLHIHTIYSPDGFFSIEDIISKAKNKGLLKIAISDHNTMRGIREFINKHFEGKIQPYYDYDGIRIYPAVELSTKLYTNEIPQSKKYIPGTKDFKCHILLYCPNLEDPNFNRLMQIIERNQFDFLAYPFYYLRKNASYGNKITDEFIEKFLFEHKDFVLQETSNNNEAHDIFGMLKFKEISSYLFKIGLEPSVSSAYKKLLHIPFQKMAYVDTLLAIKIGKYAGAQVALAHPHGVASCLNGSTKEYFKNNNLNDYEQIIGLFQEMGIDAYEVTNKMGKIDNLISKFPNLSTSYGSDFHYDFETSLNYGSKHIIAKKLLSSKLDKLYNHPYALSPEKSSTYCDILNYVLKNKFNINKAIDINNDLFTKTIDTINKITLETLNKIKHDHGEIVSNKVAIDVEQALFPSFFYALQKNKRLPIVDKNKIFEHANTQIKLNPKLKNDKIRYLAYHFDKNKKNSPFDYVTSASKNLDFLSDHDESKKDKSIAFSYTIKEILNNKSKQNDFSTNLSLLKNAHNNDDDLSSKLSEKKTKQYIPKNKKKKKSKKHKFRPNERGFDF